MIVTTFAPIRNLSSVFNSFVDYGKNGDQMQDYPQNPKSFLAEDKGIHKPEYSKR